MAERTTVGAAELGLKFNDPFHTGTESLIVYRTKIPESGEKVCLALLDDPLMIDPLFAKFVHSVSPFQQNRYSANADLMMPTEATENPMQSPGSVKLHAEHQFDPEVGPPYKEFVRRSFKLWEKMTADNNGFVDFFAALENLIIFGGDKPKFLIGYQVPFEILPPHYRQYNSSLRDRIWVDVKNGYIYQGLNHDSIHYYERSPWAKRNLGIQNSSLHFTTTDGRVIAQHWSGLMFELAQGQDQVYEAPNWKIVSRRYPEKLGSFAIYPLVAVAEKKGNRRFMTHEEVEPHLVESGFEYPERTCVFAGRVLVAACNPDITMFWDKEMFLAHQQKEQPQAIRLAQTGVWVSLDSDKHPYATQLLASKTIDALMEARGKRYVSLIIRHFF